jgi:hypothetical protein
MFLPKPGSNPVAGDLQYTRGKSAIVGWSEQMQIFGRRCLTQANAEIGPEKGATQKPPLCARGA